MADLKDRYGAEIVDIAFAADDLWSNYAKKAISRRELSKFVTDTAHEFELSSVGENGKTKGKCGNKAAEFTKKRFAEILWEKYEKVLKDNEGDYLKKAWNGFPKGTSLLEIWIWIEETFGIDIAKDFLEIEI